MLSLKLSTVKCPVSGVLLKMDSIHDYMTNVVVDGDGDGDDMQGKHNEMVDVHGSEQVQLVGVMMDHHHHLSAPQQLMSTHTHDQQDYHDNVGEEQDHDQKRRRIENSSMNMQAVQVGNSSGSDGNAGGLLACPPVLPILREITASAGRECGVQKMITCCCSWC